MYQSCPNCGYSTAHLKHYQMCQVPKSAWPAAYLAPGSAMPQVTVKIADASGIRTVPVLPSVVGAEVAVAEVQSGISASATAPSAWASACCKHPESMHVVSEDNIPPPTCLGCPDGNDEHDWRPLTVSLTKFEAQLSEFEREPQPMTPSQVGALAMASEHGPVVDLSRTITSPLSIVCDCGFLARDKRGLAAHLRGAKHRSV